jgi:hypothetical protein
MAATNGGATGPRMASGSKMAEQSPDNPILKYLGAPIFAALVGVLTWLTGGSTALTTLAAVLAGSCALVTSLLYGRYLGVLGSGAEPARSPERSAYVRLRKSLAEGGKPALIYARWLTKFLDAVERFFGDADMADRTLFPHAFGLKTPAPLWTAAAFDRCLLLALIYPVAIIFAIWVISGHVGPAEAALGLNPNIGGLQRSFSVVPYGAAALEGWRLWRGQSRWWSIVAVSGGLIGIIVTSATVSIAALFGLMFVSVLHSLRNSGYKGRLQRWSNFSTDTFRPFAETFPGALALTMVVSYSFLFLTSTYDFFSLVGVFSLVVCLSLFFGAPVVSKVCIKRHSHGAFLSILSITLIVACLGVAYLYPRFSQFARMAVSPLTLFLGLLTLLNAPFDWASLGLTRALLRRGLELGGWWFLVLALADALIAALVIALLSLTMVIGVQAFDDLAAHSGGKPILPLGPFFDGIAAQPTAPEYWWVYALLFSTMIPSIINLVIGGASLMRGVPGVPSLLLKFMPANKAVPAFDRAWIATVLTLQLVGGAILGIMVQGALLYAVFGYVMPRIGLELLDMARAVAAFDLPGRIIAAL